MQRALGSATIHKLLAKQEIIPPLAVLVLDGGSKPALGMSRCCSRNRYQTARAPKNVCYEVTTESPSQRNGRVSLCLDIYLTRGAC